MGERRQVGKRTIIFYSPWGPGFQPTNTLYGMDAILHPEIRDRFDIIGVDFRGTGISSPVNCSISVYTEAVTQPMYPEVWSRHAGGHVAPAASGDWMGQVYLDADESGGAYHLSLRGRVRGWDGGGHQKASVAPGAAGAGSKFDT